MTSAATLAFRSGSLNPIRDVNAFPLDFGPFEIAGNDSTSGIDTTVQQLISARVSGYLFELPGGRIALTALAEHRYETADPVKSITPTSTIFFPSRSQAVNSAYLELRAPLISERNAIPLVKLLELQGSVRYDRYNTQVPSPAFYSPASPPTAISQLHNNVSATSFTAALKWSPAKDLALRGSFATGFLPPSIGQLVPVIQAGSNFQVFPDPQRGSLAEGYPTIVYFGGNPNLTPEKSRSLSLGSILTPSSIPGLRLSLDYTQIKKTNEIGSVPLDIGFLEQFFPGRVVRAAPTAADIARGFAGMIESIDFSSANIARSSVKAWDFKADYDVDLRKAGRLHLYGSGTYEAEFLQQFTPTSPAVDMAGTRTGPLRWRVNAGIDWSFGQWDFGWNSQYYSRYSVTLPTSPISVNNLFIALQGSAHIPSQMYHDFSVNFRFPNAGLLRNTEVSVGVQNIFDKRPPIFVQTGVSQNHSYSYYGDPRLRRFSFSLRRHF